MTLMQAVQKLMEALENPEQGFVFDDFDKRYIKKREDAERKEAKRYWKDKMDIIGGENEIDGDKSDWLSDNGEGVERMLEAMEVKDREMRLKAARWRVRCNCPSALATFDAIVRNGNNRKESIWQLMSRKKSKHTRHGWRRKGHTTTIERGSKSCSVPTNKPIK